MKTYDDDFKRMLVDLMNSGIQRKQVSKDYGVNERTLGRWKKEYRPTFGFTKERELTPQELENRKLKKQLREVKLERDILKKAVGIFSKSDR